MRCGVRLSRAAGSAFSATRPSCSPQAVVTSIRTSGCSEVLVARRETWRVVPSPHFSQRQYRAFEPQRIVCFDVGALQVYGPAPTPRGFRPPGWRRVSAARRRRIGALRRNRPREFCVSCESVRDRLFGDIEPSLASILSSVFRNSDHMGRWPVGSRPARHGCSLSSRNVW